MQIQTLITALALAVGISGCKTSSDLSSPFEHRLKIVGATNLFFNGVIVADGTKRFVSGYAPADYLVYGRRIDCAFARDERGGEMSLEIWRGTNRLWCARSSTPCYEIKAVIREGWWIHSVRTSVSER